MRPSADARPETETLTFARLVVRRLAVEWRVRSVVFLGALLAAALICAAPVYLDALERQSVRNAVESAMERSGERYFRVEVSEDFIPLESDVLERADAAQSRAMESRLGEMRAGVYRHLRTPPYAMSPPRLMRAEGEDGEPVQWVVEGFLQSFDGVAERVRFVDGMPPSSAVADGERGPVVDALISARTADAFGGLRVGEVVVAAPSADSPMAVSARIVGVIEAEDADDSYWRNEPDAFLYPRIPTADGVVTPDSPPSLGLFANQDALISSLRTAFPDAAVHAVWRNDVDADTLKTRSRGDMRSAMDGLRRDLSAALPGAFVFSGIDVMLARFGRESFLSSVPLLLLMAVMAIVALYFLFMIAAQFAPSREGDAALLRSRGASGWRMARLHLAEGALTVAAAALIAPFLAALAVWAAGFLPYFSGITGGSPLPVVPSWRLLGAVALAAALSGGLCLAVYAIPGALGARAGIAQQGARAARPPRAPFIQRHYIDAMFLAVGGVLFWELWVRGELASGSLFGQPDVNEALLIAPALFLIAVGLVFFRAFPMFVRYIGGESAALVHLAAGAALPALAAAVAFGEIRSGDPTGWIPEIALLASFGAAYRAAAASGEFAARAFWTAAQTALAAAFLYMRPLDPDGGAVIFACSAALAALVPAQIAFYILARIARRAPAWVSMSVWRMARNPARYSSLALLLVLNGGAATLAATVGATLDQAYEDRIRYRVGSDIRVHSLQSYLGRRDGRIERRFGDIPEIESIAIALRESGRVGAGGGGNGFAFLAVDTDAFKSWERDDFSDEPLSALLAALNTADDAFGIRVPVGTDEFRLWAKPASRYPQVFLWMVVQGADGRVDTLSFGELGNPRWALMSVDVPDSVKQPMRVLSIQINEPGYGAVGTVGEIAFDDLQAVSKTGGGETAAIVEDFEGALAWRAIPTTDAGGDEVSRTTENPRSGSGAALFKFGKETNQGLRGVYRASGNGFIPAIASSTFVAANGADVGSGLLVKLPGGIVPVIISGVADYFPTMNPAGGGFLVFDADALLSYVDALNAVSETPANEVFMTVRRGGGIAAAREVYARVRARGEALGADALLAAQAADPLATAGWRLMSRAALGVVLLTSALGFAVYLLAFAERNAAESRSLRALGMSRAQSVGLAFAENAAAALAGVGVGIWAGFQMSRIIVSAVAVTETGGGALPPFILITDWALLAPLWAIMAGVFAICIAAFGRRGG